MFNLFILKKNNNAKNVNKQIYIFYYFFFRFKKQLIKCLAFLLLHKNKIIFLEYFDVSRDTSKF